MEKIALNALRARQTAAHFGLLPIGQWKWALRNLLKGKTKQQLGMPNNNAVQAVMSHMRKNKGYEVAVTTKGDLFYGSRYSVRVPDGAITRLHTHPNPTFVEKSLYETSPQYWLKPSGIPEKIDPYLAKPENQNLLRKLTNFQDTKKKLEGRFDPSAEYIRKLVTEGEGAIKSHFGETLNGSPEQFIFRNDMHHISKLKVPSVIMSDDTLAVHAFRPKLKNALRSIYFRRNQ